MPDGTTLTATASGTGTLDATSSCLTGGTTGGTCQFVVEDNGPGALDLTVTAIASTTVNGVKFTNIALTAPSTATKTWVVANLLVHKTAGGATPVAGGDPFNYTITVTNEGPLATSAPVTVTDTLGPGLEFAGMPSMPASAGSCVPPSGITFTCTITTSLAVGDTVTIVVPARVVAGTAGPVRNVVTIDSPEDPLCPNGTCPPPPPDCTSPSASTDNEACVLNSVTVPIPPPPTRDVPLARGRVPTTSRPCWAFCSS